MTWISALPLLLGALCSVTSCTWLDHPTSNALQRELAEKSRKGLALAMFFRPDELNLTARPFNGPIQTIHMQCCPGPTQGRRISRSRIVMVDMSNAPAIDSLRDAVGSLAGIPLYGGQVVEMDSQGSVINRSIVRFHPATVSLSADGEHFAILGAPLGPGDWVRATGVYVGGFHVKEIRKLIEAEPAAPFSAIESESSVDWSPDGSALLLSQLGSVSLIDVQTGRSRKIVDGGAARWSPDGVSMSYVTLKSEAALLNVSSGESKLIDPGKKVNAPLEWSPDGKYLIVAEEQGSHVYEGCLWVYRVSDGAWAPFPDYGVFAKRWYWIQLETAN